MAVNTVFFAFCLSYYLFKFLRIVALTSREKIVMDNEVDTVVVQRRAIRASTSIIKGEKFTRENLTVLRPCPKDGLPPYKLVDILDKKSKRNIKTGEVIHIEDFIK